MMSWSCAWWLFLPDRCSHGVYRLHVLAQYLGWSPRHPSPKYHPGIRGLSRATRCVLVRPLPAPHHPAPPASCQAVPHCVPPAPGPGLLLSAALRRELEGDVFNYCDHYLISSLPGSIHPASFTLPFSSPCAITMGRCVSTETYRSVQCIVS